ncbi:MAG: LamG domain-containing protein, partial [Cyclobacteriaceae bacterium]
MTESISTTIMNSYRKPILAALFFFSFFIATSQENCTNGVDDDGDGLIDCFDPECASQNSCDDFFFGNSVVCFEDVDVTSFNITEEWHSADETATSHVSPAIGDLDGNGIPEVITMNNMTDKVFILNGSSGATMFSANVPFDPENTPAIANVFEDEAADILITQNNGDDMILYDHELNVIWAEKASRNDMGIAGFADFNEDGVPEIYYMNEIVNARTGAIIVTGSGDWEKDYVNGPIAIDILPDAFCADCSGLELVTGNEIWAINIGAGTRTLVRDMDDDLAAQGETRTYHPKYYGSWGDTNWSAVSAADYNLDGNVDVLMSGALGSNYSGETTIFFWDVANSTVVTYHDASNNFSRGPGRINIGDLDGDGQMNANFVMNQKLYSLDENFGVHWIVGIKEGSSGFTGCTLFDFDGDGVVEVVYRSEESVLILDGLNGATRNELACVSRTNEEYPVVADVDGDGASEICVACYFNDATSFSPYSNTQFGHIRVFGSDGEAWMPARSVWNQHGYFNVNINDDLTVPAELQDHTLVFSDGICEYSDGSTIPFPSRPLNTFLTQTPILDEGGCVEFVSPDITLLGNSISATNALCPDAEITVTFTIGNNGDTDVSGGLPVSYYAGNPTTANAIYLDTKVEVLLNFQVGEERDIVQTINGIGGNYPLYVVVNDLGGTPPIAAAFEDLPNAVIPECETGNNYNFVPITFSTFNLSVEKLEDDRRCDLTLTPNGSARAFYFGPTPGNEESIYLENFDDRTAGDKSDMDATAWTSDPGTNSPDFYGVSTYNSSKMFRANKTGTKFGVGVVTWTSESIDISDHTDISITVDVFEDGDQEGSSSEWYDQVILEYELYDVNNVLTSSGEFIQNGNTQDDFTYVQAAQTDINQSGSSTDSLLVIIAKIHNTSDAENHYIDNVHVFGTGPDIIKEQSEADGFNFFWFNAGNYTDTLYTGGVFPQLAAGNYEVISSFPGTGCSSDTVGITIDNLNATSTPPYEVHSWIYEVAPLTDCAIPNGSLTAFVYTTTLNGTFPASIANPAQDSLSTADGYGFNWRITNDATNTTISTGDTLSNLTNQSYTVDVTEAFSGCVTSAALAVSSGLAFPPDPTIVVTNINTCGGNGTLSANVAGNTADYIFEWFDGPGIKPVADFTGPIYTVSDIGDYTVRATQISSSCPSSPVTEPMLDDAAAPILTANETAPNSTCSTTGNGIAEATVNGSVGQPGFDYTWFIGNNTLAQYQIPNATDGGVFGVGEWEMTALKSGTYTIIVEETATSCTDTTTVMVTDGFVQPEFILNNQISTGNGITLTGQGYVELPQLFGAANPVTDAVTISYWADFTPNNFANDHRAFSSGATGEGQVLLWSDNHNGLAFIIKTQGDGGRGRINSAYSATGWTHVTGTWEASTGDMKLYANGVLLGETNYTGTGTLINTGNPMYLGRDNNSGYGKFEGTFDELRIYDKALTSAEINEQMCRELNGAEDGLVAYWNFNNVAGPAVADGANIQDQSSNGHNATARTSTGSLATVTADIECPIAGATDNSSCDAGNPNGSIDLSGFITPAGSYTYTLFDGFSTVTQLQQNTTGLFSGLAAGFYTLTAEDLLTSCSAGPVTVSLNDIPDIPNIFTSKTEDTSCDAGTGSITVTSSSNITEPGNYLYELFSGFSFATPLTNINVTVGSTGTIFTNLDAGNYRIRVTNNDLLCNDFVDVTVIENITTPVFSSSQLVNDNTACAPGGTPNGLVSVSIDGDVISNYLFSWFDGDNVGATALFTDQLGKNFIDGLDAGKYTVVAKHKDTGCPSIALTKEVFDLPLVPNIVITQVNPQTDCGTGNGSLTAHVTNDPDGLCTVCTEFNSGFTFQWQLNGVDLVNGAGGATGGDALNNSAPAGVATSTVSGLIADEYTVVVTYAGLSCSASSNESVTQNQVFPVLSINSTQNNTSCDAGSYTGAATVDVLPAGAYDYDWFYSNGTQVADGGIITGSSTNNLVNVVDDTYKVVATSALGCTSDTLIVTINPLPAVITHGGAVTQQLTVCVGGTVDPNGQITVTPTTAGGEPAGGY